jgi:hypothetical protein
MGITRTPIIYHLQHPVVTWTVGFSETGYLQLLMGEASLFIFLTQKAAVFTSDIHSPYL